MRRRDAHVHTCARTTMVVKTPEASVGLQSPECRACTLPAPKVDCRGKETAGAEAGASCMEGADILRL